MKTVLLVYGGQSGEHEVSCVSAAYLEQTIAEAGYTPVPVYVDRTGVWHWQSKVSKVAADNVANPATLARVGGNVVLRSATDSVIVEFAFPIIHGTAGEDGSLQGFFEVLGLPYAGAGVASSAVCMDKALMRALFAVNNIPQVKYFVITRADKADPRQVDKQIGESFGYPVFIKPCNMGSSVGVHKVKSASALAAAITDAARFDDHLLCEQGLNVRELEIAIAGNYPEYLTSGVGEIRVNHEFYSYEAKYLDPKGADLFLKAEISDGQAAEIRRLAEQAFAAVRGDGFARIDFFLEKESGKLYLNEINTLPGFTPISMFPQLFRAAGLGGPEITRRLIEWGEARCARLQQLRAASR
ncbi:MAG: D-alanine--D-alanine ligase family protein [Turneriella sp.]